MVEIRDVVKHLFHVARHVSTALQTTEVWDWLRTGNFPSDVELSLDVREALIKYGKLKHHYVDLAGKLTYEEKLERFEFGGTGLMMHDCSRRELKWAIHLWTLGQGWRLYYYRPEDGRLYQWNMNLRTGKLQWLRNDRTEKLLLDSGWPPAQKGTTLLGGTHNE